VPPATTDGPDRGGLGNVLALEVAEDGVGELLELGGGQPDRGFDQISVGDRKL
jgi:hypothetical protein